MSSVQIVLRKKPNRFNQLPIAIRITKNRKASYLFTGQYIEQKYWDDLRKRVKKSHPNASRLNCLILNKLSEANNKLIESEVQKNYVSSQDIKREILGTDKKDFFDIAELHLKNLKSSENYRAFQTQTARIKNFRKFLGRDRIAFEEITVFLLKDFEGFILTKQGRKPRTAVNYMILIRKIFNLALADGIVERRYYPFGKGKIQIRIPESEKVGLSIQEVQLLETANDLSPSQRMAVDVWLLSFYFAGIRVGDILRLNWNDFRDGRLHYRMNKNQKLVSLKIPEKASKLLFSYKKNSENDDLVFPFLKGTNQEDKLELLVRTRTITRNLNRRLQLVAKQLGIEKKLTMHIARHTFGNISGDRIPIQMLQKLYRHSSITTTVTYQSSFMKKDADDALDKVINF
jgi:integrase